MNSENPDKNHTVTVQTDLHLFDFPVLIALPNDSLYPFDILLRL